MDKPILRLLMKRKLLAAVTLACVLTAGHWAWAQQATFVQDDGVKLGPASPALPSGAQQSVLVGDPSKEGVDAARDLAARIPGARFKEFPGDTHSLMFPDMEPVVAEIQAFVTGERPAPPTERVLATVLFTDIVGSTETAAQVGDAAWSTLLSTHHATVRRELGRHRGQEVDTAGDGFLATFDGPARAIRCALSIRDELRELGIRIRAGVHTGECELAEGHVRGIAIHIGARVMSLAEPDEVLVSSSRPDTVDPRGPKGT
jgi:hypothetical protein